MIVTAIATKPLGPWILWIAREKKRKKPGSRFSDRLGVRSTSGGYPGLERMTTLTWPDYCSRTGGCGCLNDANMSSIKTQSREKGRVGGAGIENGKM